MNVTIKLQKTSRLILFLVRIVQAILLFSIIFNIYISIKTIGSLTTSVIQAISIHIIVFLVLFIAATFLKSIQLEHTPFTSKNVARLKTMAICIAAIEPIGIIINIISNILRPISSGGFKVVIHSYMGGMIIVLGLIIFCIALAFEHGNHLQKQSDETL